MTTALIFLSKLVFAVILLVATMISTLIISPFMLACWILGIRNAN